jgi:general secretion pathway protein C
MIKRRSIFQLILTTLVIIFAADISMKIINSRLDLDLPETAPAKKTYSEKQEVKPFSAFAKILQRNLFQKIVSTEPEKKDDEETTDHPVTNLKLILKGTVVGTEGTSFAVIEDQKLRTQNLYHINDSISSGVTLAGIYTDRVVINRNGNKELLLMFQEDNTKKGSAPALRQPTRAARTIKRQEIREAVSDLRSLMRDIRIIPHFSAGKRDGFTVTYVRQGSRLEQLGLKRNDIIKEINGTAAGDFKNIFEIFNKYANVSTLDLGVERDNQRITISYTLE